MILVSPTCVSCFFCLYSLDNLYIWTSLPVHTTFNRYTKYIVRPKNSVTKVPDSHGLSYKKLAYIL